MRMTVKPRPAGLPPHVQRMAQGSFSQPYSATILCQRAQLEFRDISHSCKAFIVCYGRACPPECGQPLNRELCVKGDGQQARRSQEP